MAHSWNVSTNFVLNKKTFFYKFHSGFGRAKCTLENISKNVNPHKKPFYMVMTTRKSFEKLDFMYLECQKKRQYPQNMAHSWNVSTNFVLNKKTFFYKFHSGFGRAKCTLENISKNVSPHKKPFYMVMTTRKRFQKLDFMYLECQKKRQWPQKMAHCWNVSTNFVLNTKTFFYKFHSGFGRAKCTLENISKNVSPHKKPFYMVMTTRKSFQKLDFMYLECQKKRQWRQKMGHCWNDSTNFVLNKKTFFINSTLDLGEQNAA